MSPGKTMMRVYDVLKARVVAGDFAPGSRLDPMALRGELGSSATPIRDALHRLTGERIIESWRNEGFRIPHVSEPAIRDLYEWAHDLSHVMLRSVRRHDGGRAWTSEALDYPDHLRRILLYLAARSRSPEHVWAAGNLADRSALLWRGEAMLLDDARQDIEQIESALLGQAWSTVSKSIDQLHRRRSKSVAQIASWVAHGRDQYFQNVF